MLNHIYQTATDENSKLPNQQDLPHPGSYYLSTLAVCIFVLVFMYCFFQKRREQVQAEARRQIYRDAQRIMKNQGTSARVSKTKSFQNMRNNYLNPQQSAVGQVDSLSDNVSHRQPGGQSILSQPLGQPPAMPLG